MAKIAEIPEKVRNLEHTLRDQINVLDAYDFKGNFLQKMYNKILKN